MAIKKHPNYDHSTIYITRRIIVDCGEEKKEYRVQIRHGTEFSGDNFPSIYPSMPFISARVAREHIKRTLKLHQEENEIPHLHKKVISRGINRNITESEKPAPEMARRFQISLEEKST